MHRDTQQTSPALLYISLSPLLLPDSVSGTARMFDKKGMRQIAHQPQRVLPSEKYKLGNRLEIPARTARLRASHQ